MARLAGLQLPLLAALLLPQQQAERAFRYFTQLGDRVLNQVDAVLQGRVEAVTALRGTDVVRVGITTWYFGERAPDQGDVTLLAAHGDFFVGTEQLLFLKRYENGPRFKLHNRIARSDPEFDAKLKALEQTIALRDLAKEEDRRRQVRKMIYDDAASRVAWTRWHAFHELEYLRSAHRDLVTPEDRDDLARLAARSDDAAFQKALLKLLKEWSQ